jgi:mannose-6-phosphate isomerase-like protein (cupin superfamily)
MKPLAMKKAILVLFYFISIQTMAQLPFIPSGVYHWAELPVKKSEGREGRKIMEGSSPQFSFLEMHASTQEKGVVPRPPHAQKDLEEVLIVKEGTMKFTIGTESRIMGKNSVVLIPPLTYYVLEFRSNKPMDLERSDKAGGALFINADSLTCKPSERGGGIAYFNRPTAMCENFEMHITQLDHKGPSHAPHAHVDTEIMLMIEGESEVTVNNKTYKASAGDLYILNSGEMHGISNTQNTVCKYFAFKWR